MIGNLRWYRALAVTILLLMLFYLGLELYLATTGFLKWIGMSYYYVSFLIVFYIIYNFIKWNDKELEEEGRYKKNG